MRETAVAPAGWNPAFSQIVFLLFFLVSPSFAQQQINCNSLPPLTGDTSTAGRSCQTQTTSVNGTTVPPSTGADQILVTTSTGVGSFPQIAACGDGSHAIGYSTVTHSFFCQGLSGGSGSSAWSALTTGTNGNAGTFAASGNSWDFTATSIFKLRVGSGLTTSANGDQGYDSAGKVWHMWQNGSDRFAIVATGLGVTGQPCLSNSDGSCTFADPIVSGPDTPGVAPTKNPVQVGFIGADGNVHWATSDNSGNLGVQFPSAQPVTVASLPLPSGASTSANQTNGNQQSQIVQGGNAAAVTGANALKVDGSSVTQPVSVASVPLPSGAATSANQTNGTQQAQVTDGAGHTQPAGDSSARSIHETVDNSSIAITAAALPLPSGASTDATLANPQVSAGATTAPNKVSIVGGKTTDATPQYQPIPLTNGGAAVKTDASATTQPISSTQLPASLDGSGFLKTHEQGTAAVSATSLPLPSGAATSSNQTNASQKTQIVDGSGNVVASANNALNVDSSGAQASPLATWTSSTALNTVATPVNNTFAFGTCSVSLVQTSTITAGAAAWETSIDGVNWFTIGAIDAIAGATVPNNIVTFQANTNRLIQSDVTGYSFMRIRLSTAITGTGSVTIASTCQSLGSPSLTTVYQSPGNWVTQDAADMTGTVPGTAPGFTHIMGGIFNSSAPSPTSGQTLPFQLNSAGSLKVDGSAVTQPVSVASVPLPAGAATSANQTNGTQESQMFDGTNVIGTASHPVQVSLANTAANGTAVKVDGSAVTQPASLASLPALAAGSALIGKAGFDNTTPGTTNGVTMAQPARTTGTITTSSSSVSVTTTGYSVATVTVNGTYAGITINFKFSDDGGTHFYVQTCVRTDTNIQEASEALPSNATESWDCGVYAATNFEVLASAFTSGTANIGITLSAAPIEPALTASISGTVPVSIADGSATTLGAKADAKSTATDTTSISIMQVLKEISAMEQAPASRAVTNAGTFAEQNTAQASTSSAAAATSFFAAANTTAATVKSSAGNLYGGSIYNPNATACFLQVFNATSGSVTLGTTTPIFSFPVPNGPATSNIPMGAIALSNFSTAISIASTTTATGSSTCATGMTVNLWYN